MASILLVAETNDVDRVAIESYGSVDSMKKKRRRRVSFAKTQTVHFIPRKEDVDTPPLDSANVTQKPPSATRSAQSLPEAVPGLAPYLKDETADLSHFTCDMDTGHGSWADDDTATRRNSSLDGTEEDSGCFVRLENLLDQTDDDSIINDDVTVDATTFTKNLSQILKSGTTFDSGTWGKISAVEHSNGTPSADDSMALTTQARPHRNLAPNNVSIPPDEDESDMSLASGIRNFKWKEEINTLQDKILSRSSSGTDVFSKREVSCGSKQSPSCKESVERRIQPQRTDKCSTQLYEKEGINLHQKCEGEHVTQSWPTDISCDSDVSMSISNTMDISRQQVVGNGFEFPVLVDGNKKASPVLRQNYNDLMQDSTFSTADFNSTVPVCNLKDLLLDHTDYTIMKGNITMVTMMDDDSRSLSMDVSKSFSSLKQNHDSSKCSPTSMDAVKEKKFNQYHGATDCIEACGVLSDISNKENTKTGMNAPGRNLPATPKQNENLSHLKAEKKSDPSVENINVGSSNARKNLSFEFANGGTIQDKPTDNIVKVSENPELNAESKSDLSGEIMKPSSNKTTESSWKFGNVSLISRRSHSSRPITLGGMLQQLQDECCSGLFEDGDELMPVPATPCLQTLSDYLLFSCSVLPQLDRLKKHVQELKEKTKSLKEYNSKIRDSKHLIQRLTGESSSMLKYKFEKKLSVAKKESLIWEIGLERQNLESLQENKDILIKEVAAAQGTAQQVLQLKESYLETFSSTKLQQPKASLAGDPVTPSTTSKNTNRLQDMDSEMLQKCHQHYEDACRRLIVTEARREKIEGKINSILSVYSKNFCKDDTSFAGNLKALVQKLTVINNLLQQHQASSETCVGIFFKPSVLSDNQFHISTIGPERHGISGVNCSYGSPVSGRLSRIEGFVYDIRVTYACVQVMKVSLRNNEGRSESQFAIERMYSQTLQYEGDGPLARVNITRSLRQEAIDMAFPCMDAFLAFQYLLCGLQNVRTVQVQHVHQLIQQTGRLFGCLMDLLKEIKYCQRNLRISCKFQMKNDRLFLTEKMLRPAAGMKISLIFDMTFIRDGKYCPDLLPTEVLVHTYGCSNANITSKEVSAKIARVESGFGRFYRICSCIDDLLQHEII